MATIDNTSSVLLSSVLVPVILLVLKNLLSDEIAYWVALIGCYFVRPFDLDKNPDTHDWAMIYNDASGEWECCSLTFHFGLRKGGNGAFVYHYDAEWKLRFIQRVPFGKWKNIEKGRIVDVSLIPGLESKMQQMKLNYKPS